MRKLMVNGIIKKTELKKLGEAVSKDSVFYVPVRSSDGISLVPFDTENEIDLNYSNFKKPAKRLFFPQNEMICTYNEDEMRDAPLNDEKRVLFGLRPCDVVSVNLLDKIFLDDKYTDPYYEIRRKNTVIISLGCKEPMNTCYCTSVGGSPSGNEGTDILARETDDSLLLESYSEKGEHFINTFSSFIKKPQKSDKDAVNKQSTNAEKKISKIDFSNTAEKLDKNFESPLWEEITRRCLGCGVCTFLCPTCHCFGIYDEKTGSVGSRSRVYDSCMFPFFTLEASGHNPRALIHERMRQRVMHKFLSTVKNFGDIFCVGCGRCIGCCPAGMDIRETVREVIK
jgi:ferredoxin